MRRAAGSKGTVVMTFAGIALLGSFLAACEPRSLPETMPAPPVTAPQTAVSYQPPAPPPDSARMQCVTYARAVTGLDLRGDAWRWWAAAGGRYGRGPEPSAYSVLVLAQGVRLNRGHVAVVREVLDSRRIRVDHANWNNDERIVKDMLVVDVSAANDWTEVKFWNERADSWGNVYLAYGFIYPPGAEPDRSASLAP
jgi:CHAP domain-containing protein